MLKVVYVYSSKSISLFFRNGRNQKGWKQRKSSLYKHNGQFRIKRHLRRKKWNLQICSTRMHLNEQFNVRLYLKEGIKPWSCLLTSFYNSVTNKIKIQYRDVEICRIAVVSSESRKQKYTRLDEVILMVLLTRYLSRFYSVCLFATIFASDFKLTSRWTRDLKLWAIFRTVWQGNINSLSCLFDFLFIFEHKISYCSPGSIITLN